MREALGVVTSLRGDGKVATKADWIDEAVDATLSPYDRDYWAWLEDQLALLRAGTLDAVDWDNVIEELDGLSKSQQREVASRIDTAFSHLLKLQFSLDVDPRAGWCETVDEQRKHLALTFTQSRSLRQLAQVEFDGLYVRARRRAERGMRMAEAAAMPRVNPYTLEELLDEDFIPGGRPVRD